MSALDEALAIVDREIAWFKGLETFDPNADCDAWVLNGMTHVRNQLVAAGALENRERSDADHG